MRIAHLYLLMILFLAFSCKKESGNPAPTVSKCKLSEITLANSKTVFEYSSKGELISAKNEDKIAKYYDELLIKFFKLLANLA